MPFKLWFCSQILEGKPANTYFSAISGISELTASGLLTCREISGSQTPNNIANLIEEIILKRKSNALSCSVIDIAKNIVTGMNHLRLITYAVMFTQFTCMFRKLCSTGDHLKMPGSKVVGLLFFSQKTNSKTSKRFWNCLV